MTASAAALGRQNHKEGDIGQAVARYTLQRMGIQMLEPVHTPWKVMFQNTGGRRKVVNAFPVEKVSGDFRGVAPGGRSVLVEVKSRSTRDTFRWSDLEPHQRDALQLHHELGGLSLVCWVIDNGECLVMAWPLPLAKGKSLSWNDAVTVQWIGY